MHRTSLAMLKLNPFVLWMDCTYKTNRYKMPLLDIIGASSVGTTFFISFVFLQNEKEESYRFALECLEEIYTSEIYTSSSLRYPCAIFTDKEQALFNMIYEGFLDTNIMICLWHVNKNIKLKARPQITTKVK